MHRFLWDLTYPEPDVLERDYPISAIYHDTPRVPLGATVLPGQYTVRLTVAGKTYTQPLTIRMDPRVKTLPDDLAQQFELDRKIATALHEDFEALQQVRSLRGQLKPLAVHSADTKNSKQAALTKAAADLEAKAASIEGEEGDYTARYLSTQEGRTLARLNSGFSAILSALDTADAAPTTQQQAMFVELEKALQEQLSAWSQLKSKDIPDLNEKLKKAGQSPVDLHKPEAGAEDSPHTTTQDKDNDEP